MNVLHDMSDENLFIAMHAEQTGIEGLTEDRARMAQHRNTLIEADRVMARYGLNRHDPEKPRFDEARPHIHHLVYVLKCRLSDIDHEMVKATERLGRYTVEGARRNIC